MTKDGIKYLARRIHEEAQHVTGKLGVEKPSLEKSINSDLAAGIQLRVKSASELNDTARKVIAGSSYNRKLEFTEIFIPSAAFQADKKMADAAEAANKKLIEKINDLAQAFVDDINTGLRGREAIEEFQARVKELVK